ncbi:MAG: anti-anti-sigma factor [Pedosphaera sp.]|nr:anti-anti-sigma factor [Pedosphaera sp.]
MTIHRQNEILSITGVKELGLANRDAFCTEVRAALPAGIRHIVIDFSETDYIDCGGLGALMMLRKAARNCERGISLRLVNPTPPVRHLLNLTKMASLFSIEDFVITNAPAPRESTSAVPAI